MKKQCTKCKESLPLDSFGVDRKSKSGMNRRCKSCINSASRKYRTENLDHRKSVQAKYNANNRDKNKAYIDKYKVEHPEKLKSTKAKWAANNAGVVCAYGAEYRAMKKTANPRWSDSQYIEDLYTNCREAEDVFSNVGLDVKFHVDHIVPLQNDLVCGLHVESNLQILTARENRSKNNRFNPDNSLARDTDK